ncbi:MAG: hypothetical protein WD114_02310 [Phycisphaerales bacterium]
MLHAIALAPLLGLGLSHAPDRDNAWWRDAVFYEVFVRSYND